MKKLIIIFILATNIVYSCNNQVHSVVEMLESYKYIEVKTSYITVNKEMLDFALAKLAEDQKYAVIVSLTLYSEDHSKPLE